MSEETEQEIRRVYLDYAASTPVHPEVLKAMEPFWNVRFGNSGSIHKEGVEAKEALEEARESIAMSFNAQPRELIFTGSGTEANNIAIFGVARYLEEKGRKLEDQHFITSCVEHPSVIDCFKVLEGRGARVDYISVTQEGSIDLKELKEALSPETVLISVMQVNNEIGTIHPIAEVAKIVHGFKKEQGETKKYPYMHTDASQGLLYLNLSVLKLGVDLLTIDGQKVYGPKGVGGLFIRRGTKLAPFLVGGNQEFGLRPGTVNIPLIVGFQKAVELADNSREHEVKRLRRLQIFFVEKILKNVPNAELNGGMDNRIANNINFSFPGEDSEDLLIRLDAKGISCGTRSACVRDRGSGSYVVRALGKSEAHATSSLRFSLGINTTEEDVLHVVNVLKEITTDFDKRE